MRAAGRFAKALRDGTVILLLCSVALANAQNALNPETILQTLPYGGVEVAAGEAVPLKQLPQ